MNEESIFFQAIECSSLDERLAFLESVCGDDPEKRDHVECLLKIHESVDDATLLSPIQKAAEEASWNLAGFSLDLLNPSSRAGALGKLDHYEVLQVIGVGGTSLVLEAFDTKLERIVAIKVLSRELCRNSQSRERFQREAKAAAAVSHQNVTQILGVGEQSETPYLVMEFVNGRSLQQRIREERALPVPEICRIGIQIAEGLAAIHERGLVHRDIKPGNIILSDEQVKITDFGLTRPIDHLDLTRTGEAPGTPEYMSPEQAQSLSLDQRSDLFSLGSVLYTMATGESPFQAPTVLATMKCVCDDDPQPIRKLNSRIPRWLREVINELLQKDPELRISSANEVVALLAERARPRVGWKRRLRPFRPPILWPSIVAAVALLPLVWTIMRDVPGDGLLKQFARGMGKISVLVDDPEVEIQITDGRYDMRRKGTIEDLPIGPFPHRVIARKDGVVFYDRVIDISKWEREQVEINSKQLLAEQAAERTLSTQLLNSQHPPRLSEVDTPGLGSESARADAASLTR